MMAGRFQFRLRALEQLRAATRDEARGRLAEALRADDVLLAQQRELAMELQSLHANAGTPETGGSLDVDRLVAAARYEIVLRAEQQAITQRQAALATEIDQRRAALLVADRELRTIEKLRERQQARHLAHELREETKSLDEAGSRCRIGDDS